VSGNVQIAEHAQVRDFARLSGNLRFAGSAVIGGKSRMEGSFEIRDGFVFDGPDELLENNPPAV
jgi:UDP-3-O-[3-hydroxymyristoyl] glucosamine N-acyltransferase